MKRNLVGKILGKIKIFVQDFVPIRTALIAVFSWYGGEYVVRFFPLADGVFLHGDHGLDFWHQHIYVIIPNRQPINQSVSDS